MTYTDGHADSTNLVAGQTDPNLVSGASRTLPDLVWDRFTANWFGQDGVGAHLGDVHVQLANVAAGRTIAAATLSDNAGQTWVYRGTGQSGYPTDFYPRPLDLVQTPGAPSAELFFSPVRDEAGQALDVGRVVREARDEREVVVRRQVEVVGRADEHAAPGGVADGGEQEAALARISHGKGDERRVQDGHTLEVQQHAGADAFLPAGVDVDGGGVHTWYLWE